MCLVQFDNTGDATVNTLSLSDGDVTRVWHMQLGHFSENGMTKLSRRELLDGQSISKSKFFEHSFLEVEESQIHHRLSQHKGNTSCMHSDLWGPSKMPFGASFYYMLTIIDDFSRKVWMFFLKQQSDVFTTFKEQKTMISKRKCKQVKHLQMSLMIFTSQQEFEVLESS